MSYPGPPGLPNSLPPRPPPSKPGGGFKSTFGPAAVTAQAYPATTSYSNPSTYSAPPASVSSYGAPPPGYSYSQSPAVSGAYGASTTSYGYSANYTQQPGYYGAGAAAASSGSYSTPPQIRNPFPQPGAAAAAPQNPFDRGDPNYDADMAAQIAQWQSAYLPKEGAEATATTGPKPVAGKAGAVVGPTFNAEAAAKAAQEGAVATANEKKKTVYREGGGKKWADDSLLEWDPSHLRLFVGNLAGETTDDSLLKAFSRWQSVQKAKVVRDKRTNKSKGYGFVSFSDPDDFFQSAKEMNGKYIQSHPVVVRKSTTEIKPASHKDNRHKGKNFKKKGGKNVGGSGVNNGEGVYSPHLGPNGGGIVKPGQKTKSGLKMLG
ncbi:hypothetical protein BD289DRAFT_362182 [Coniella lustricola]|uniref:RRM domain-containing protein n=1 Tax=Coniella lustricola TaxID=2025994 RepID=A0A2T3AGZ4_9PEZI|nr:hypothetical protein BD289DRAFT_362182 [Coniella lustricola]